MRWAGGAVGVAAATGTPALKIDSSPIKKKEYKKIKIQKDPARVPPRAKQKHFSIVHHLSMIVAMIMMPPPILLLQLLLLLLLLPLMMMNISPVQCLQLCYDFDLLLLFIVPNAMMMATGCRLFVETLITISWFSTQNAHPSETFPIFNSFY